MLLIYIANCFGWVLPIELDCTSASSGFHARVISFQLLREQEGEEIVM
jgi:hypothetical protein